MDFIMKNLWVLELEMEAKAGQKGEKEDKASSDGESDYEERTTEMARLVLHSEVPAASTCAKGIITPGNMGELCRDKLSCITRAAQATTSFFKYETFDVGSSAI
eukprot:16397321-Heterocapsa_arctica.AAC.1